MKKIVKITEQDLHNLIMEAMNELSHSTYRSALQKMKDYGQYDRARAFADTHDEHYSDKENGIAAHLADDSMSIHNSDDNGNKNGSAFYADGSRWASGSNKTYDKGAKFDMPRTSDRKRVNKQVAALDHFYGGKENNPYTKNDFISEKRLHEAISRAIKKTIKK